MASRASGSGAVLHPRLRSRPIARSPQGVGGGAVRRSAGPVPGRGVPAPSALAGGGGATRAGDVVSGWEFDWGGTSVKR